MKSIPSLLIAAAFATLTFAVWAYLNRPTREPPWPPVIWGFDFSPFRANEDPTQFEMPTDAEIDADLGLLEGKVKAVRTYSVGATLADVPELAERHGLNVALGAWLDSHRDKNEEQLKTAIELADNHQNVVRVIVGNEVLLRGDLTSEELEKYLDRAREAISQPVGTAETWNTWLTHPELAQHVDFIGVHLLPYWEGVAVDKAIDYSLAQYKRLQKAFPHKPIVVAEIGWPSRGRTHESAVASVANEALFLRRFLYRARKEQITCYVMEAFDQPWKAFMEGAVGSYWGVYDVERRPKFAFTAPIVRIPEWHILAAVSIGVSLLVLGLLYLNSDTLRNRGRSFLAVVVYAAATIAVWVIYDFTQQYMARHPVALLACARDSDGSTPLEHRHLPGHRTRCVRGRGHEHRLSGAQSGEMQQSEVGRHAGRAEHSKRGGDWCLARMQQPRMMPFGDAQLLQSAIEHDETSDTEDIMARLDDFPDAVRRNHIAGPR